MKFLDICAGIGGFRSGLEQAGHECVGYVEIDKYARKSYEAMYDTKGEWTEKDITKVRADDVPRADIWCFGFPCQDISLAGQRKGLSGRRSGIFYDIIDLIKSQRAENKPRWLLIENVKNLLSIGKGEGFTEVLVALDKAGYDAEWYLINSKDHGVPQNRERVYIIGHLRDGSTRQLLPNTGTDRQTGGETQPAQQARKGQSKSERQEKYGDRFDHLIGNRKYQNSHVYGINGVSRACDTGQEIYYAVPKINLVLDNARKNRERVASSDGISRCLTSTDYKEPQKIAVPKIDSYVRGKVYQDYVQSSDGLSRTITARDYKDPQKIAIPKQIISGNQAHRVYDSNGLAVTVKAVGGGVGAKSGLYAVPKIDTFIQGKHSQDIVLKDSSISRAIISRDYKGAQNVAVPHKNNRYGVFVHEGKEYNIRRLTPRECFRLQGFTDEQFEKAQAVNSNTQLYKQAGNAVTVNVAREIGKLIQ